MAMALRLSEVVDKLARYPIDTDNVLESRLELDVGLGH
jgi:hypothetical protein